MKKLIANVQRKFPGLPITYYEKAFVWAYLSQNNLVYKNGGILYNFISENESEYMPVAFYLYDKGMMTTDIDDLITAFEMLVNADEKKNKGIVYTPTAIRNHISERIINSDYIPVVIDPACGCGAFLISAARVLKKRYSISYMQIFKKFIYGCDIAAHNIDKCKILFSVLALLEEGVEVNQFPNLYVCNSLEELSKECYKRKFDVVVGNPPYVRAKNIDEEIKPSLENWKVVTGNADLYIPFHQLGIKLLKDHGWLGYISPNTFLQSVNGRGLRNYLRDSRVSISIINFKETQNFPGVTHYTCIVFVNADGKKCNVDYALNKEPDLGNCSYTHYEISDYANNQEWRLGNIEIDRLVHKIEHQPRKLGDFGIRNGLATLCNDIYFFRCDFEDSDFYYRTFHGVSYRIEKDICIDVAKPNIMRNGRDLIEKGEKAIFPYKKGKIIEEDALQNKYPYAYHFLLEYKDRLQRRDKGKTSSYPAWYAYGRTQGMNNTGLKLLIPYMADRGVAIISENQELLFYCGYAVFAEDTITLKLLKNLIESDVFLFYIRMTSKPYSKGFMALAKNYIKNFGIPILSDEQKRDLLSLQSDKREKYIASLYGVDYTDICHFINAAS